MDTHAISICAAASESGLNVLMLVALRNSENSDILDELKERRILWALDNGFEYIEVDALRPTNGMLFCAIITLSGNCIGRSSIKGERRFAASDGSP